MRVCASAWPGGVSAIGLLATWFSTKVIRSRVNGWLCRYGLIDETASTFCCSRMRKNSAMPRAEMPGPIQIGQARLVGRLLLAAGKAHEPALRIGLAAGDDRRPDPRVAGRHAGRHAQEGREDHLGRGALRGQGNPAQMAARDVPDLVRDHAGQLARVLRAHQEAGVEEQVHAAGDEGVQLIVLDDVDLDRIAPQSGRLKDRPGQLAQGVLDLGVADQANLSGRLRRHRRERQRRHQERSQVKPRSSQAHQTATNSRS